MVPLPPEAKVMSPFAAPEQRDELLRILGRHLGIHDQHHRRVADDGDRREVARHVERHALHDARKDHDVVGDDAEREAVGRGAGQRLQAEDPARARLVVDDDRMAQRLGERLLRGRRDRVDARAGRVRQDEADRPVGLREHGDGDACGEAGEQGAARQQGVVHGQRLQGGEGHAGAWARSSSNEVRRPAMALAATVGGLASQTCPGPERPGKLRLMALTVT
jgi:hypothetical protein